MVRNRTPKDLMRASMSKKPNTKVAKSTKSAKSNSASPMDTHLLEQIVKLMAGNDLNTVDIRDGDKRVIIKRGFAAAASVSMPAMSASPALLAASAVAVAEKNEEADYVAIKSPMVGTYYASPSPEAKAFLSVGSHVSDDTDVCIIEAMKVFNNIKAECRGTVVKIMAVNGQTVEFGQTLFLVKP